MKLYTHQQLDFYKALKRGELPSQCISRCSYDQHLFDGLFPLLVSHPAFDKWFASLETVEGTGYRYDTEVPVIETNLNITRSEVACVTNHFINSFMIEAANSLVNKQPSYNEVFAVLLDAVYTFQLKHYTTLATIH